MYYVNINKPLNIWQSRIMQIVLGEAVLDLRFRQSERDACGPNAQVNLISVEWFMVYGLLSVKLK